MVTPINSAARRPDPGIGANEIARIRTVKRIQDLWVFMLRLP
jgi:hypothetical protein